MKSVALVLLLSLGLLFQRGCGYCRWHTRQSYTSLAVKKCSEHSKPEAIPEIFNGSPISYKSLTHNSIQKFCRAIASTSILPLVLTNLPQRASAEEITTIDEGAAVEFAKQLESSRGLNSDEFIIEFSNENLGLKLGETSYKGFPIVSVKDIKDPFLLQNHPELKIDAIVVAVNGLKTDGLPLKLIADTIKGSTRPVYIKFRDPNRLLSFYLSSPPHLILSLLLFP